MKSTIFSNDKMRSKAHCIAGLLLITSFGLFAQTSGGGSDAASENGIESTIQTASVVVRQNSIDKQIRGFMKQVGMKEGINTRPKDKGGDYFVAVGKAEISAHRSAKNWVISRSIAYENAMVQAKSALLITIAAEIEAMTQSIVEEGSSGIVPDNAPQADGGQGDEGNADEQPSLFEKIVKLCHMKLDQMLEKQGKKPAGGSSDAKNTEPTKAEMQKIMRSEEFRDFVRTTSKAVIAGMQAFQCFEDLESGRNGEVAVIGIVSDKTLDLAASVGSGKKIPRGKPNKPIADQIPDDDTEAGALQLLNTYGVKTMYDENGDLVIVSFNFGTPLNSSSGAELTAQSRAGNFAMGNIRKFLGEQIARSEDAFRSQSVKDYEDETREVEASEGGKIRYEAMAERIKITGITPVKTWKARHPINGQMVVGSVRMWSPSSQAFAGMLRGKMAKAAAQAAGTDKTAPREDANSGGRKQINTDQEGDYKGTGIQGDSAGF